MFTVAITGGSGFIGQHLAAKLTQYDFQVRILSRKEKQRNPFPTFVVDYQDISSLTQALRGVDYLVNLTGCLFSFTAEGYFKGNVLPTRALIQAANKTPTLKRFIHISSQAAAGPAPTKQPIDESFPCNPVADYGRTKLAAEKELSHLKTPFVFLRPPIVYGPNASGLSDLTPFLKYGFFVDPTPTVLYSVIHVEDLTNAIVIAIQKAEVLNQTFFVADPNAYTWKQLIQAVANRNVRFLNINPRLAGAAIRLYQFFAKPLKGPALLNYDKINEMNITGHWLCSSQKWVQTTGQSFRSLSNTSSKS